MRDSTFGLVTASTTVSMALEPTAASTAPVKITSALSGLSHSAAQPDSKGSISIGRNLIL